MEGKLTAVLVRSLELRDIEDVLAIQSASPEIAQWNLWDYDRVARGAMAGWVAEIDAGEMAGFLVARLVAREFEILNFAVRPRRGAGESVGRSSARRCDGRRCPKRTRRFSKCAFRMSQRCNFTNGTILK